MQVNNACSTSFDQGFVTVLTFVEFNFFCPQGVAYNAANVIHSKATIYKVVCKDATITDCYVGSTTDLARRCRYHKACCSSEKQKHLNLYKFINLNGGWENFSVLLVEKFPCCSSEELISRTHEVNQQLSAKLNLEKISTPQQPEPPKPEMSTSGPEPEVPSTHELIQPEIPEMIHHEKNVSLEKQSLKNLQLVGK